MSISYCPACDKPIKNPLSCDCGWFLEDKVTPTKPHVKFVPSRPLSEIVREIQHKDFDCSTCFFSQASSEGLICSDEESSNYLKACIQVRECGNFQYEPGLNDD